MTNRLKKLTKQTKSPLRMRLPLIHRNTVIDSIFGFYLVRIVRSIYFS